MQQRWYAIKCFFNRTSHALERLSTIDGLESYVPMQQTVVERNGRRVKVERQAISSLAFIRITPQQAIIAARLLTDVAMIYSRIDNSGRRQPAPIDDREMDLFRLVVDSGADGLEYMADEPQRFSTGEAVRVTAGPLAGAEGRIVRIRGDRRLVVSVRGVCAVATSYIPQNLLERINPQ